MVNGSSFLSPTFEQVSVDVRADQSGTLSKIFVSEETTVNVGADLFELDTDSTEMPDLATATDVAGGNSSPPARPAARTPLIKFVGKRSLVGHDIPISSASLDITEDLTASKLSSPGTVDFADMPPMFKRVPFTEEEITLIQLGGAEDTVRWTY